MPPPPRRGRPRSTEDKSEQNTVRALDRAMAVLEHLAQANGLSLSQIATLSDEAPATVYRVLITLAQRQIVDLDEATQVWHIGPGAFRIGVAFLGRTDLAEAAGPVMAGLAASVGETVTLGIEQGGEVVFIRHLEGDHPVRALLPVGMRAPLYACATGKALLAYIPGDPVSALVEQGPLQSLTASTIVNPALLRADLSAARKRGYSVDDQEFADGMRSVAAPVFGMSGTPVGALGVCGPAFRLGMGDLGELGLKVRSAAAQVSLAIGGAVNEATKSPD
jgi:IclR family transcriptional regulator, acetate operon repressor